MTLQSLRRSTFFRFILVGGSFALIYSVLTALVTNTVPLPKPLLAALVWAACIPPAFYCQRRFAFAKFAPRRGALGLYAATQGMGMGIAAVAAATLVQGRFWPDTVVFLGASALAAVLSFGVNRLVIFTAPDARTRQ